MKLKESMTLTSNLKRLVQVLREVSSASIMCQNDVAQIEVLLDQVVWARRMPPLVLLIAISILLVQVQGGVDR